MLLFVFRSGLFFACIHQDLVIVAEGRVLVTPSSASVSERCFLMLKKKSYISPIDAFFIIEDCLHLKEYSKCTENILPFLRIMFFREPRWSATPTFSSQWFAAQIGLAKLYY